MKSIKTPKEGQVVLTYKASYNKKVAGSLGIAKYENGEFTQRCGAFGHGPILGWIAFNEVEDCDD